jgi:hypothetical protein
MNAAYIASGGALVSKLQDLLAEARWRGDISPAEYRSLLSIASKLTEEKPGNGRQISPKSNDNMLPNHLPAMAKLAPGSPR